MGHQLGWKHAALAFTAMLGVTVGWYAWSDWTRAHSKGAANESDNPTPLKAAGLGVKPAQDREPLAPPEFLGSLACKSCHQAEYSAHRGSHHDRAIEIPSDESVLAPFAGEQFAHDGVVSTFVRKGERYVVRTLGADGKMTEFPVAYTFGVTPLQQYLLDVGAGRLQALTVAWDSRPKSEGGERYFDLYPQEQLTPTHEIHFTRPSQNWNFACGDCHTTNLKKGYDPEKNSFEPTWSELDVGCEACHGPGSRHVDWAKSGRRLSTDSGLVVTLERSKPWSIPVGARTARPRPGPQNQPEIDTCAPCHSRREQLREGRTPDEPYLDAYLPELLRDALYFDDGQIESEVYVYASFRQSRMFHAGVRCSDCHEPHSLELRSQGNDLCTACHSKEAFDTLQHHHHAGQGSACVDCHMPERTYMQIDPRRDHSLRIPRPDLSAELGSPNACTLCHQDKEATWAAAQIDGWFGPARPAHFGRVFHAARQGAPGSARDLAQLLAASDQPSIVRGTAAQLLARFPSEMTRDALQQAVSDPEPFVRLGAAHGSAGLPPEQRLGLLVPLLDDPLLSVRTQATRTLVGLPPQAIPDQYRSRVDLALARLAETERLNLDRPEAHLRLALIAMSRGDGNDAVAALNRAIELDPYFTPAMVNLADLYRSLGKEEEAEQLLRRALGIDEENAEAWHALGLALIRQKRLDDALPMLVRSAELRPDHARFHYVLAVALSDAGRLDPALAVLLKALERHPHDRQLLGLLMNLARQKGDGELVQAAATRLAEAAQSP